MDINGGGGVIDMDLGDGGRHAGALGSTSASCAEVMGVAWAAELANVGRGLHGTADSSTGASAGAGTADDTRCPQP
jgi:hypothetical protein